MPRGDGGGPGRRRADPPAGGRRAAPPPRAVRAGRARPRDDRGAGGLRRRGRSRTSTVDEQNRRSELIEDLMIAANGVTARFLEKTGFAVAAPRRALARALAAHRVRRAPSTGSRCPPEPDSKALEAFLRGAAEGGPAALPGPLARHREADGRGRVRRRGAGQDARRPLRPRGARLHALDGAEPALPGPHHAAPAQGRARAAARRPIRERRARTRLAAHCTEQEDAANKVERLGAQVRGGAAPRDAGSASASTAS